MIGSLLFKGGFPRSELIRATRIFSPRHMRSSVITQSFFLLRMYILRNDTTAHVARRKNSRRAN